MNEKIKEIAEQAYELKQNTVIDPTTYTMVPAKTYRRELNVKKFAELIIQECCQFNYDFLESYREASEVNSKIRQYFGVEEEPEIIERWTSCNEP